MQEANVTRLAHSLSHRDSLTHSIFFLCLCLIARRLSHRDTRVRLDLENLCHCLETLCDRTPIANVTAFDFTPAHLALVHCLTSCNLFEPALFTLATLARACDLLRCHVRE